MQLCELANPAKWDNPEWMKLLRSLEVVADHKLSMHRKSYELTQLLFGLTRLGRCREDASIVSVGAGHEPVLYWLANHAGSVTATDLYEGRWQSDGAREGDEGVLARPADYAPFAYRRDRLAFRKMDGRHLTFPDAAFDVAYSLSSIEHFGGTAGAGDALDEMARVVKPGGLVVVRDPSTSWPGRRTRKRSSRTTCVRSSLGRSCASSSRSTRTCTNATSMSPSICVAIRTRRRTWWCVTARPCSRR